MNDASLDDIAGKIRHRFPADTFTRPGMDDLLAIYATLVLVKGAAVTNQDVHHAWVIWARKYEPESPNIVPYDQLDAASQAQDSPFMQAIREIAAEIE
jgi:hypothetical protein